MIAACANQTPRIDIEACVALGGTIDNRGMFGRATCVTSYEDASIPCSDSSECNGRCLLFTDGLEDPPTAGTPAHGECESDNATFGCFMEIVEGRAIGAICVD